MSSVRALAADALYGILVRGEKPKDAVESLSEALNRRDRAFLMEVVYGVLRRRDALDWILKDFLSRPGRLNPGTLNSLRAGVYQIFFMRVPEWAAVNETVKAEKKNRNLVNAVLRRVLREKERLGEKFSGAEKAALDESLKASDRARHIATLTSHPLWLIKRWIKRFGPEEAYRLAQANNNIPPLTLRVNTLKIKRDEMLARLMDMGFEGKPTSHSPEGIRLKGRVSFKDIQTLSGLVAVQDEASQVITHLLSPQEGERVLDACAAPGGKTTHIAQTMKDRGEVTAVDIDEKRIQKLKENVSTFGLGSVRIVNGDITGMSDLGPFDRALLDAPCSATGVIRRNPDVKYRHTAKDLIRFREKQLILLNAVAAMLKPGGTLLYSTCSTEPEEGEEVVNDFLKTSGDYFIIDDILDPEGLVGNGFMRTFPHRHDMDGFFGARIKRIS
jgi:16S rRNA (cytosine967-C5)-methyltransferase